MDIKKHKKHWMLTAVAALAVSAGACDIDQTEAGELPDVDVEVEAGEMPAYDVDIADVDVGTVKDTVVVERPSVDVDMPDDDTTGMDDGSGNR